MPKPTQEHEWLHKFIGQWTTKSKATMGPDQPPMQCSGTLTSRKLGGFWVLNEMKGEWAGDPVPEGMLQAGFENKIMRASLTIGKMTIMASDGCDDKSKFDGFRLALSVPTESAADSAFNALAEGGKVDMPLMKTFWSPRYGMVTDMFGVGWMVMVPGEAV
jgi:uncharacterized glyoxalase superfamily protein PhnB